jgi:uncharacterized SAM-binding protein YcdF (DUF218 family)
MFFLKKIISPFFMPVPACLLLAVLGLIFLWFTRKQKTGKVLLTISTVFLGLLSYDAVSDMLAKPLEEKYPPIRSFENIQDVKWIVVLAGGSGVDPGLPPSTYLSEASLVRLSEGVFLHNRLPQTKLILTGRSGFEGFTPVAEVMADTASEWGVKPEDIIIEAEATDTKDHPIYVKEIVGSDEFILVTSASHMPRAIALFRKHDMKPIPAPTDYMAKKREGGLTPGVFFPGAGALEKAERAIHEYLGIMWAKVRKQF